MPLSPARSLHPFALVGLGLLMLAPLAARAQDDETQLRERLVERQQEIAQRWRRFGDIEVDWEQWTLLKGHDDVWVAPWRRAITRPMSIGALSWPEAPPTKDKNNAIPERAVAVDCGTLTVNRKRAGGHWGEWRVPQADSPAETLLIEACTRI